MKMLKTTVACGLLAVSTLASAEHHLGSFSANLTLASDYIWRGISQTDNEPALQGGVDWSHDSGLYAGIWASNIDSGFLGADVEVDSYIGYSTEVSGVGVDVGFLHYEYPGAPGESDLDEVYVGLSYDAFSVTYSEGVDVLSDTSDFGSYLDLGADFELPMDAALGLHMGHYDVKFGGEDYWDWKVSVSKEVAGFTIEAAYTDTDDASAGNLDDSKLTLSISASL